MHPALAVLVAVLLVMGFVFVQGVAFGVVHATWGAIDVRRELTLDDAMRLSVIQAAGLAMGLALVATGVSSWAGVGLRAAKALWVAGWNALLPVGLLLIVPTIAYVLASGGDLVHEGVTVAEAFAYVLLALLISANEELWFRGLVVDALGGPARPWLVVVVSSLLFGLPHFGTEPAAMLNMVAVTLAVGVPFAVVRLRHVSLVPLIAWHAVIDVWAFVHTSSVIAKGEPTAGEIAAGLVLPGALAAGYVTWFARSRPEHAA